MPTDSQKGVLFVLCLVWLAGCTSVGEYTTGSGECYQGDIVVVDAAYQTQDNVALGVGSSLQMKLDTEALEHGDPGTTITTSNLLFAKADVIQMYQLNYDLLSMFQFPTGRVRNYLAYAQPTNGSPATVIVSLMENLEVEVRILRPDEDPLDEEDTSIFGVYRLTLRKDCTR
jgi:hypothetical protein